MLTATASPRSALRNVWIRSTLFIRINIWAAPRELCLPGISSRKHAYIIFTPLNPHFYIVELGFTGVYVIFLIFIKKQKQKKT